jgi:hypothetical protein
MALPTGYTIDPTFVVSKPRELAGESPGRPPLLVFFRSAPEK